MFNELQFKNIILIHLSLIHIYSGRDDIVKIVSKAVRISWRGGGSRQARRHCLVEFVMIGALVDSSDTTETLERCVQCSPNSDEYRVVIRRKI